MPLPSLIARLLAATRSTTTRSTTTRLATTALTGPRRRPAVILAFSLATAVTLTGATVGATTPPAPTATSASASADQTFAAPAPWGVEPIAHPSAPLATHPTSRPKKRARTRPAHAQLAVDLSGASLPLLAFQAYHQAAATEATTDPACHLPWWLLAGIGHTESGNAEGGRLYPDGTTRGRILGPRLDGHLAGNAVIRDTDHGLLDGDPLFDRAVGPMQFIPSTWRLWGADGNHDGKRDPNNIFDASLAAANYLCADGRDLATPAGIQAAILSYNDSAAYLATVLAWGHAYRDGGATVTDSALPVITDVTAVRPPLSSRPPAPHPTTRPAPSSAAPRPTTGPTPTAHPTDGTTSCPPVATSTPAPSDASPTSAAGTAPSPSDTTASVAPAATSTVVTAQTSTPPASSTGTSTSPTPTSTAPSPGCTLPTG